MAKSIRDVVKDEYVIYINEKGQEVPDPRPIEIPAGFKRPETLAEQVRRLVRSEALALEAQNAGMETFEEAEDFEIDDDMFDPSSPFEEVFDPVLGRGITLEEFRQNEAVYRQRYMEADERAYREMELSDALRARPKKEQESSRAASERASQPEGGDNESK